MNYDHEEALIFDALSAVETPRCDLADGVKRRREQSSLPRRSRHRPKRTVLIAACLLLALAVSAAAVAGISSLWREFLGDTVPGYAVSTVGVSQTAGEYTLTVEDVMADSRSILVLFALTRSDGGLIDPEAHLNTNSMSVGILVDGERISSMSSGFIAGKTSQDGKTRYLLYEGKSFSDGTDLIGKQLTFHAPGVAVRLRDSDDYYHIREAVPVSLARLAGITVPDFSELQLRDRESYDLLARGVEPQSAKVAIPLPMKDFPQYLIRGAVITEDGLSIVTSGSSGTTGSLSCSDMTIDALIDTRNGTRYQVVSGQGLTLSDGTDAFVHSFSNCPLPPEDLPYCEVDVSYALDRILSTEPFSITFPAEDTGAVLRIPLKNTLTVEGVVLHPDELTLSSLGVNLRFLDSTDTAHVLYTSGIAPILHMKNGIDIQTTWDGGYGGHDGVCSVGFGAKDAAGQRIFLDVAEITALTFGDLTLPVNP